MPSARDGPCILGIAGLGFVLTFGPLILQVHTVTSFHLLVPSMLVFHHARAVMNGFHPVQGYCTYDPC